MESSCTKYNLISLWKDQMQLILSLWGYVVPPLCISHKFTLLFEHWIPLTVIEQKPLHHVSLMVQFDPCTTVFSVPVFWKRKSDWSTMDKGSLPGWSKQLMLSVRDSSILGRADSPSASGGRGKGYFLIH